MGMFEILIILAIVLLLFGSAKVPDLARSLGKSIHEFKKSAGGTGNEPDKAGNTETGNNMSARQQAKESPRSRMMH